MKKEMKENIHRLLDGELSDYEADNLWVEILDDEEGTIKNYPFSFL